MFTIACQTFSKSILRWYGCTDDILICHVMKVPAEQRGSKQPFILW